MIRNSYDAETYNKLLKFVLMIKDNHDNGSGGEVSGSNNTIADSGADANNNADTDAENATNNDASITNDGGGDDDTMLPCTLYPDLHESESDTEHEEMEDEGACISISESTPPFVIM